MKKSHPEYNSQRYIKGFLFFPKKSIGFWDGTFRETRWLEYAYWKETYYKYSGWVCYYFMTEEEYYEQD